jgi:hypothetical protein
MQIVSDFIVWGFLHERLFAELRDDLGALRAHLDACVAVVDGIEPMAGSHPALFGLTDLWRRMAAITGSWWSARFSSSLKNVWRAVLDDAEQRALGVPFDIARYSEVRSQSIGVQPALDLIELARATMLPPELIDDPLLHDLRHRTASIALLAEDLFSYELQVRTGNPNNFVHLLMVHEEMSLADAVNAVIGVHNDLVARFDAVAGELERRSPSLRFYVDGQRRLLRGSYDWRSGRAAPAADAEGAWT